MLGALLARRFAAMAFGGLLVAVLLVPLPTPGWPPDGWVMVACDVGQGDGLVLNAGHRSAVVVDAGPDPRAMDGCLRRLGIERVPLVVLTHFHADHVDGLAGVLRGRPVGALEVTSLAQPASGVRLVQREAARAGVPLQQAAYGESRQLGPLRWQVVAPSREPSADSESPPNDSSVVLLVETRGIRILLMGDEEESSQSTLLRQTGGLRADVLKVAHHGSASQEPDLVRATGARLAVISVGVDNDYGHPAPSLMALLRDARMQVSRTDRDGDVAVVVHDGLRVAHRGAPRRWPETMTRWEAGPVATYSFSQVDVFGRAPLTGNPVAVVHDATGLDDDQMAAFARWTNLSETTFLLPPTAAAADYRLRIFTPAEELPFAGHPTLGSAHAWLARGGVPAEEGRVVQECGVGLVELRNEAGLSFRAPAFLRFGPVDEETLARAIASLRGRAGSRGAGELDRQRARLAGPPAARVPPTSSASSRTSCRCRGSRSG